MLKKYRSIKSILFPSKKLNIFILSIIILGIILGSIFSTIITQNDQNLVIEKIKLFITNISDNSLNTITSFKNSISINLIYIIIIWILGMTLIGIPINTFLLFIKNFILGFSLSSFILTYSYKGLILSSIYLIFGELLTIIILSILTTYSIIFSSKLLKHIFKSNIPNEIPKYLKNYSLIFVISIILCLISSISESFLVPTLIKLIIKLYI